MNTVKSILSLLLLLGLSSGCKQEDPINTNLDTIDFVTTPEFPFVGTETSFKVNDPYRFDNYEFIISFEGKVDTLKGSDVKYTFDNEGEYNVSLLADGKEAKAYIMNLLINKYVAPKTLYVSTDGVPFSSIQGQLYSVDLSKEVLNKVPLEIECGQNTRVLQWVNDRLYFFSSGDRLQYSLSAPSTEDNVGFVKSFDPLLYSTTTHISFTNAAYDDSFTGFVTDEDIYWADRNFAVGKINRDDKNRIFTSFKTEETNTDVNALIPEWFFVSASSNPLYVAGSTNDMAMGTGSGYHHQMTKIGDEWWINKLHEGDEKLGQSGIWKLVKDEEKAIEIALGRPENTFQQVAHSYVWLGQEDDSKKSQILDGYYVSKFVIYKDKIYFSCALTNGALVGGIYSSNIDGSNVVLIEEFNKNEVLFRSPVGFYADIVVDEDTEIVYWTQYNNDILNPTGFSGIKSYNISTKEIKEAVVVDKPLGLAIAPAYLE